MRADAMSEEKTASGGAMWLAKNFGVLNATVPKFLNLVNVAHRWADGAGRSTCRTGGQSARSAWAAVAGTAARCVLAPEAPAPCGVGCLP